MTKENATKQNTLSKTLRATPFWLRTVLTGMFSFLFLFSIRFANPESGAFLYVLGMLLMLLTIGGIVWSVFGAFRKQSPTFKAPKPAPRPLRIVLVFTLIPLLWIFAGGTGTSVAVGILPYSDQELAKQAERAAQAQADAKKKAIEDAAKAEAEAQKQKEDEQKRAEADAAKAEADKIKALEELQKSDPLKYTAEICRAGEDNSYLEVDLKDRSFFINSGSSSDTKGEVMLACVMTAMDFSSPLISSIGSTNALAGTKTWSEKGFNYQWSYHPDSGVSLSGQAK